MNPLVQAMQKKALPKDDTNGLLETILAHLQKIEEYLKIDASQDAKENMVTTQESHTP